MYYQNLLRTAPTANPTISHGFMHDKQITHSERRHTLQYRYGGLYTGKLAYRYGHAPSPLCVLCHQMDGGHHSVSGCPAINKLVIERHNAAARCILKSIANGQMGGSLVMTDVGNKQKMLDEGFTTCPPPRIPQIVLPTIDAQTRNSLKPDGLIVSNLEGPPADRQVKIVEIKYAADTRTDAQEARAQLQHDNLHKLLIQEGYAPTNVQRMPIVLGVGGTIFTDTLSTLSLLGVSTKDAEKTMAKVHILTVKWLHKIYIFKTIANKTTLTKQGMG
jgi:hypothetical protein